VFYSVNKTDGTPGTYRYVEKGAGGWERR